MYNFKEKRFEKKDKLLRREQSVATDYESARVRGFMGVGEGKLCYKYINLKFSVKIG